MKFFITFVVCALMAIGVCRARSVVREVREAGHHHGHGHGHDHNHKEVNVEGHYYQPAQGQNNDCDNGYCLNGGTCFVIQAHTTVENTNVNLQKIFCKCIQEYNGDRCQNAIPN
nr:ORF64 [Acipenserid herpesvirus 1]